MPATVGSQHIVPAAAIEDLNNRERAIALYASDMPANYSYRVSDAATLTAWITQGAARVGLDSLYALAAVEREHRLRWLDNTATREELAAHARRFPKARRLRRAEEIASCITLRHVGLSQSAKARQSLSASAVVLASAPVAVAA
ncbi:hypothetical protein [Streptomyces sp. NPDC048196]|uniref:hypothetical protein n=1 Tax=Streptomyces sp. NPDC048196 TaxID=3154712 RepID=UPI0033E12D3F